MAIGSIVSFNLQKGSSKDADTDTLNHIRNALKQVGCHLMLEDDVLTVALDEEKFQRARSRNAGRLRKVASVNGEKISALDVILMSRYMSDAELMLQIDMKSATFYRHKKSMMESEFYRTLDMRRLDDKAYISKIREKSPIF